MKGLSSPGKENNCAKASKVHCLQTIDYNRERYDGADGRMTFVRPTAAPLDSNL